MWLLLRRRGKSPIGWDLVPAKKSPSLFSSLLSSLSHRRAVLLYSMDFLLSLATAHQPLLYLRQHTHSLLPLHTWGYRTHVTDNIYYAINELRQLRHGWEGGRHQSQGIQVMYARQILQSYMPTESLAKAQKTVQTACCRDTWWGSLQGPTG